MQSARHALDPVARRALAGEPIAGSWWGHPKSGREIFRALNAVYASPDVVATTVVDGKLTLVHRAFWPALATLAYEGRIERARMGRVTQEHTASGRHEKKVEPFPDWLPVGLELPSVDDAISLLGERRAALLLRRDDGAPRSRPVGGPRSSRTAAMTSVALLLTAVEPACSAALGRPSAASRPMGLPMSSLAASTSSMSSRSCSAQPMSSPMRAQRETSASAPRADGAAGRGRAEERRRLVAVVDLELDGMRLELERLAADDAVRAAGRRR